MRNQPVRTAVRARLAAATLAFCLAAAAAPASAQEVHAIDPGSTTVVGTLEGASSSTLLPIQLLEGAPISLDVKAGKGSALHPRVTLLGLDRVEDGDATAGMIVASGGARILLKDYIPKGTGLHWIRIEGADGTTGSWTFKSKVKLPKGAAGAGDLGTTPVPFPFVAPGGAIGKVSVKGAPSGSGAPSFVDLRNPAGAVTYPGELKVAKTGFSLGNAEFPKPGRYILSILPGLDGPGTFKVKIKWKAPKFSKQTLDASKVIADPILIAFSPAEGNVTQSPAMSLTVDFAQPGAQVKFKFGTSVVTIPSPSITHFPGEVRFSTSLAGFSNGLYDVSLTNPDGGTGTLKGAFSVATVSPEPTSVTPNQVYEGAVRRLRITGSTFFGNVSVRLRRGEAAIPGVPVGSGPGTIDADFNLAGADIGLWDLGMTNPGAPEAILAGALDILQVVTLTSMSPTDTADGRVVEAVILGSGFLDGATAILSRNGGASTIEGTGLSVVSLGEMHVTFDATAAEPAYWDLVVATPAGAVVTLPGVFRTLPVKGEPSEPVQPISATFPADGPLAIANDPTREEYLLAWVEEDDSGKESVFTLYAQKLDSSGEAIDKPVSVSSDSGTRSKRTPVAGYDPVNDEYLVVWTEHLSVVPTQTTTQHPSGKSSVLLYQVMAQRLSPGDLSPIQSNVRLTDSSTWSGSGKGVTWALSDFNSHHPAIAFDPVAEQWEIAWMLEFDTTGLYGYDDYDVFQRSFHPSDATLGKLVLAVHTDAHEGDPSLAWDGDGERMLLAHNARASAKSGDLDVYLDGSLLVKGGGDDLGDPRIAVDASSGTVVISWTRVNLKGTLSAEAATVALSDLTGIVGETLVLGSGAVDMLVRPVVNDAFAEVHLLWSRMDADGNIYALRLAATSSAEDGLKPIGEEIEISSGSGDEGMPVGVYAEVTGEVGAVWMEKIQITGIPTYQGDIFLQGIVRGSDFWFQRFQ